MTTVKPEVAIEWLDGNCPVQGEGTVDGVKFYFRSRGASWSMRIGGENVYSEPSFEYGEPYGTWPDAGWITQEEALSFIEKAAGLYAASKIASSEPTLK